MGQGAIRCEGQHQQDVYGPLVQKLFVGIIRSHKNLGKLIFFFEAIQSIRRLDGCFGLNTETAGC